MAEPVVTQSITVVDPSFYIPDGVTEFVHEEYSTVVTTPEEDSDEFLTDDSALMEETLEDTIDEDEIIPVPEIIGVSQILRTSPGGQQVVDVTVEVEDIPGYTKYELRITNP